MPSGGDRRPIIRPEGRDLQYASLLFLAMCKDTSEAGILFNRERESLFRCWVRLIRILCRYRVIGIGQPPSALDAFPDYFVSIVHPPKVWYPKPRPLTDDEQAVRDAASEVLANPEIIIVEQGRLREESLGHQEETRIKVKLAKLEEQRQRLLKLYQMGEIQDDYLETEVTKIRTEVSFLEGGLRSVGKDVEEFDIRNMAQACKRIREWVEQAEGDDFTLITEALQLNKQA